MADLVVPTEAGLFCPVGGFYIDPWNPVDHAVITHAHGDHARAGSGRYLAVTDCRELLVCRLGPSALDTVDYGEQLAHGGVQLSFHPAGHVLGSAQLRLEYRGEVWVCSGDYKLAADPTCRAYEPVRCDTLITESTFGLPIFRWEPAEAVIKAINAWWRANREAGRASLLFAYSLGKAQRVLAGLDAEIGPIFTHGATEKLTRVYRTCGVALPPTTPVAEAAEGGRKSWAGAMIVTPPSAAGSTWTKRFARASDAITSGWMQTRGVRRRRSVDRGFVLSDHADWAGLLAAVENSGAQRVLATHGFAAVLARHLRDRGLDAGVLVTRFGDEDEATGPGESVEGNMNVVAASDDSINEVGITDVDRGGNGDPNDVADREGVKGKAHVDHEKRADRPSESGPDDRAAPNGAPRRARKSPNVERPDARKGETWTQGLLFDEGAAS